MLGFRVAKIDEWLQRDQAIASEIASECAAFNAFPCTALHTRVLSYNHIYGSSSPQVPSSIMDLTPRGEHAIASLYTIPWIMV